MYHLLSTIDNNMFSKKCSFASTISLRMDIIISQNMLEK